MIPAHSLPSARCLTLRSSSHESPVTWLYLASSADRFLSQPTLGGLFVTSDSVMTIGKLSARILALLFSCSTKKTHHPRLIIGRRDATWFQQKFVLRILDTASINVYSYR